MGRNLVWMMFRLKSVGTHSTSLVSSSATASTSPNQVSMETAVMSASIRLFTFSHTSAADFIDMVSPQKARIITM